MRRLVLPSALSAFFLVLAAAPRTGLFWAAHAAPAPDYSYARIVRLSLVDGDVQVSRPEEEGWQAALVNLPIRQGYAIATGQGRAEVEFESGATAWLAENTLLQFAELALSNGARITKLTLTQGTATFYANLSSEDSFVVRTPHLVVSIPENARFRLDANDTGTTVSVLKGDVGVESQAGAQRLTKGQALILRAAEADQPLLVRTVESDQWDRWVANRNEVVSTSQEASLQYVNAPFRYGLADLASYGNWVYLPAYGHCWQPGGLPIGWSPYWNGRWLFLPGIGWSWVSYEPWGWIPYHYGRWAFTNIGWIWIPGFFNTWQPSLVYWVQVGNFVGWGPLDPRDRPGQLPNNLAHGTVVNTPRGILRGVPNQRFAPRSGEPPRILSDLPAQLKEFAEVRGGLHRQEISGQTPAGGPSGATNVAQPRPAAPNAAADPKSRVQFSRKAREPAIVFDPAERSFVNVPPAPAPPSTGAVESTVPAVPKPPVVRERDTVSGKPQLPPRSGSQAGTSMPQAVPQRGMPSPHAVGGVERPAVPQGGKAAPARVESPRPAPSAAPPPRVQSPPPRPVSSPPPRSEPRSEARPHGRER
jgi:ferric-dicitrate binding protein FerR (iron transport regulator)